jgi:hypothetical protein
MRVGYALLIVLVIAGLLGGVVVALVMPPGADPGLRQILNASGGVQNTGLLEVPFPINPFAVAALPGDDPVDNMSAASEEPASLPLSGDDALVALISDTSVPILALSVQNIHAVYYDDERALSDLAGELRDLSASALSRAEDCDVSSGNESIREEYMIAMREFISAGDLLAGMVAPDPDVIETAFDHIALGTEHLHEAMRLYGEGMVDSTAEMSLQMVESEPSPTPAYPGAFSLNDRYCHDYPNGEGSNVLSVIVESTREIHAFTANDLSRKRFEAEPGREYLLVVVKFAHVGFKGDGKSSSIRLPALSAFTLLHGDESYKPMTDVPVSTFLGETYAGGLLALEENDESYLFFDVPESLNVSEAHLKVSLGNGAPIWSLEPVA